MRDKIVSVRVDGNRYKEFLEIVAKFTISWTNDFPSRTEKRYLTRFPDKPYHYDKYTLADLIDEAMREFIEKYKDQSFKSNT
jgi:hypothetical protein